MSSNTPIPEALVEWAKVVRNKKLGFGVRDTYVAHLEQVREVLNRVIMEYYQEKFPKKR